MNTARCIKDLSVKRIIRCLTVITIAIAAMTTASLAAPHKGDSPQTMNTENIAWLGHDTFRITGDVIIYTDPFDLKAGLPPADIILITHEHRDHCSPDDLEKILGPDTVIVATPDCGAKINRKFLAVAPGDLLTVRGVDIEAVPAYNTNKKFHPKDKNWVGYVFTVKGRRIYLAGDTDRIPEMKDYRCEIALLPVSGTYVMTAQEAAQAALDIMPTEGVIPMHYGSIVGERADADSFAAMLQGKMAVTILLEK